MTILRGSCLCGAIAYAAAGPVAGASHCYCAMCQKQHGAAAGSYANVARAGLVIERGADDITEYASSDAGSGRAPAGPLLNAPRRPSISCKF